MYKDAGPLGGGEVADELHKVEDKELEGGRSPTNKYVPLSHSGGGSEDARQSLSENYPCY